MSNGYKVLAVGGVTNDKTAEYISTLFPALEPVEPSEPTMRMDLDGDGVAEEFTVRPVEMPQIGGDKNMQDIDPGFSVETSGPEDTPEWAAAQAFAEENGLTAVLVQRDSGNLMVYNTPQIRYMDQEGNLVEPEGAPSLKTGFEALFSEYQSPDALSNMTGAGTIDFADASTNFDPADLDVIALNTPLTLGGTDIPDTKPAMQNLPTMEV